MLFGAMRRVRDALVAHRQCDLFAIVDQLAAKFAEDYNAQSVRYLCIHVNYTIYNGSCTALNQTHVDKLALPLSLAPA